MRISHKATLKPELSNDATSQPQLEHEKLYRLIARHCTAPSEQRPYYLFAVDRSSYPRPHAPKLADRSCVYAPNQAPGNKPIVVGHQYANLVYLPEKSEGSPPWVLPLLAQRVDTQSVGHEVDISLMEKLLDDDELDLSQQLCVLTADTPHTSVNCRCQAVSHDNLILVARMRNNRNVFAKPVPSPSHVMRDFSRLVGEIGTPAAAPITRGIPQGRQKGETQPPRPHQLIVYKKLRSETAPKEGKKSEKPQSTGFENQTPSPKPLKSDDIVAILKELLFNNEIAAADFLKKDD